MNEWRKTWGINIQVARRRRKLTQRALADLLGVSQAAVGRWETGVSVPTDAHKIAIATALDEDVRTLFPLTRGMS